MPPSSHPTPCLTELLNTGNALAGGGACIDTSSHQASQSGHLCQDIYVTKESPLQLGRTLEVRTQEEQGWGTAMLHKCREFHENIVCAWALILGGLENLFFLVKLTSPLRQKQQERAPVLTND